MLQMLRPYQLTPTQITQLVQDESLYEQYVDFLMLIQDWLCVLSTRHGQPRLSDAQRREQLLQLVEQDSPLSTNFRENYALALHIYETVQPDTTSGIDQVGKFLDSLLELYTTVRIARQQGR